MKYLTLLLFLVISPFSFAEEFEFALLEALYNEEIHFLTYNDATPDFEFNGAIVEHKRNTGNEFVDPRRGMVTSANLEAGLAFALNEFGSVPSASTHRLIRTERYGPTFYGYGTRGEPQGVADVGNGADRMGYIYESRIYEAIEGPDAGKKFEYVWAYIGNLRRVPGGSVLRDWEFFLVVNPDAPLELSGAAPKVTIQLVR